MRKCEKGGKIDLGSHTNARVCLCVPVFVNVCMLAHVCVNIVCKYVLVTVPLGTHVCVSHMCVCMHLCG